MVRKVAFACDHAAVLKRQEIIDMIKEADSTIEVEYMGPTENVSVDYPDYAEKVALAVASGAAECGVLVCGTGIGMSIAANKVKGIRAALCHDHLTAQLTRVHNDANIVCIGERVCGMELIRDILITFLTTPFSQGDRHKTRIAKVAAIEKRNE